MKAKNKIKIGFLLGRISKMGGISRVTSIICRELAKNEELEIHVIGFHKTEETTYDWDEKIQLHYLVENRLSMKKGLIPATFTLRKKINSLKLDILICAGHIVGPLGVLATAFKTTKLIYWSHSSFLATTNNKYRVANEKITARFCDTLICLTKEDITNYKKHTSAKIVNQIYNPVDQKLFIDIREYEENSNKILSVGRLTDQKNFLTLVEVAKIVLKKNPSWSWHIYGSGEQYEALSKKIDEYGIADNLKLMGHSNTLYKLYSDYGFLVMTSKYEGFPMSLLEGMAKNLPLVSFDIPTGPKEIIRNAQNGYLINAFDVEFMAEKIDALINDKEKRISFSNANKNYVEEFKMNTIMNQWIALFKKLVKS